MSEYTEQFDGPPHPDALDPAAERVSGSLERMVSQPSTVCACCGKSESEHHQFVPVMRPPGCKCSVTDWRDKHNIPPVCGKWEAGDCGYYCKNCEHDRECHAG